MKLSWKKSTSGRVIAAQCGKVRVGYVTHSPQSASSRRVHLHPLPEWTWSTNFLQPNGGCYAGRTDSEAASRAALEAAFDEWLAAARLTHDPR